MRKNVYGRKFKRDKDERKALFKSLLSELVMHGRIKTTEQKAKAIKPDADRLVTKAKKNSSITKRLLERDLFPEAVAKVISDIGPSFQKRNGGYTRIVRLGKRFSDNASTVILEWVEREAVVAPKIEKKEKVKKEIKKTPVKKSPVKKKEIAPKKKVARKAAK